MTQSGVTIKTPKYWSDELNFFLNQEFRKIICIIRGLMYVNMKLNRGPQTGNIKHRVHAYFLFIIYANKWGSSVSERLPFFTSLPGAKGGLSRWLINTTAVSTQELRTNLLYEFTVTTYAR